jgi:hypothetical protein
MANGNVYVFNVFSETLALSPNGLSAGTVAGYGTNYVPAVLKVPRVLNPNEAPGKFYNGSNRVILNWDSGLYSCMVPISGDQFPITIDLLLYISRNTWTMYNTYGVRVETGEVQGGPALAAVTP